MKKVYSIILLIALVLGGTVKAGELTVANGTGTNANVPYIGNQADRYQRIQMIYPKSELADMAGASISKITFYLSSAAAAAWNAEVTIGFAEVSESDFSESSAYNTATLTTVYAGVFNGNASTSVIELDSPFDYSGDGNLLVDIQTTKVGAWKAASFTGKNYNYGSIYGYNATSVASISTRNRASFLPKTTFTYTEAGSSTCAKPSALTKGEVTANTAAFTWTAGGTETSWQYLCLPAATALTDEAWAGATSVTEASATVTGLAANTAYKFYVRAYCSAEDQSAAVSEAFTTEKSCYDPKSLAVSDIDKNAATISWAASGKGETKYQYTYAVWGETANWEGAPTTTDLTATLSGLTAKTSYQVWVRSYCAADDQSEAITEYFTTLIDCSAQTLPLSEDFSDEDNIACWKMVDCNSSTGVSSGVFAFNYTSAPQYLISPELTASAKQVKVELDYRARSTSYPESFKVGYSTTINDKEAFTWLDEVTDIKNTSATEHYAEILPTGVKFIAIQCTSINQWTLYIDNFAAAEYEAPACPAPKALAVSEIKTTSAKLAWTKGSDETAWKLQTSADGENWNAAVDVTENPYTLSGLTENTLYYVRVAANCGEEISDYTAAINFRTECEAKTLPFTENFADGLPACWSASAKWSHYAYDTYSMRYTSSADGDLVLPAITLSDAAQLTFKHQSNYVSCSVYINDGENETKLGDFAKTGENFKTETIDISAYTGKTVTITFRGNYYSGSRYLYIDDIAVEVLPCAKPTELTATAVDDSKVKVSWTSEVGKYNFQWREVGKDWSAIEVLTANEKTLEGLTLGSSYEFQVQAVCSETRKSEFAQSEAFAPKCPTPKELVLSEETYNSVKVSWTAGGSEAAWKVTVNGGTPVNVTEATYTASNLTTGTEYTILVQAECGGEGAEIKYTPAYSVPASATVNNATDNGASATWEAVADAAYYQYAVVEKDATPNWEGAEKAMTNSAELTGLAVAKEYDFYVRAAYSTGEGAAVKASFATVLVKPELAAASEITTNSAKLTWTKAGAQTAFEYAIGNDPTALTWKELAAGTLEFTMTGLTANTQYTFYLRSVYTDAKSDSVLVSFTTLCGVYDLPFEQNFNELTSGIPACWENVDEAAYGVKWAYTATGHEGAAVRLNCNSYPASTKVLATPTINLSTKAILKFWYQNAKGGEFAVKLSANGGEQVTLAEGLTGATTWTEKEIDLSAYEGKNIVLYFCGTTNDKDNAYIYLDDVTITAKPGCSKPQITATTVRPDGAKIEWAAGNGETQFQYACFYEDYAIVDWTLLAENVFSVTIEGLYPDLDYNVYVRAYCSADMQSESVMTRFTPSCPAPTAVTVSDVTATGAKISWTAAAGITKYQYKLNDEPWATEQSVESPSLELSSLTPNTLYTFSVRSFFNDNIQSAIATIEFRTECAAISELPWSEDFNDFAIGAAPNCWETVNANAEGKANVTVDAVMDFTNLDSKALVFYGKASQGYSYIKFPEITASLIGKQITFTVQAENYDKSGAAEFGYFDGDEFKLLKKYTHTTGAKVTVDPCMLDAANGKRLAFGYLCNDGYEYGIAIDNIVIEDKPSCTVPTELKVTEITATSAKVTWTSDASKFALFLKEGDGEFTEVNAVITESSYTLTGLKEHTTYNVQVQSNCGGEDWSTPTEAVEFETPCAVKAFGYTEDFSNGLDACWDNSDSHGMYSWDINEETIRYRTTSNTSNYAALVTPWIAIANEGTPVLLFDWSNDGAKATLYIEVEGQDAVEFKDLSEATEGELVKLYLTDQKGKTVRFTFKGESSASGKYMTLDNFQVIEKPFLTPTEVVVTPGINGAEVTWQAAWDETAWNLRYKKVADAEWTEVNALSEKTRSIDNLEAQTEYEVQVQAVYGENKTSQWTVSEEFETLSTPSGIDNTAIEASAIKRIVNGQLVIELGDKQYNAQGVNLK